MILVECVRICWGAIQSRRTFVLIGNVCTLCRNMFGAVGRGGLGFLCGVFVYPTDRSKAVVPVLILLFVALWFILRGDLFYVLPCVILFLCFSVLLELRLPRLGKRELILVLFVRLFDLCSFRFVGFLFLLVSGKGCELWLWHSLDFSPNFFGSLCWLSTSGDACMAIFVFYRYKFSCLSSLYATSPDGCRKKVDVLEMPNKGVPLGCRKRVCPRDAEKRVCPRDAEKRCAPTKKSARVTDVCVKSVWWKKLFPNIRECIF